MFAALKQNIVITSLIVVHITTDKPDKVNVMEGNKAHFTERACGCSPVNACGLLSS